MVESAVPSVVTTAYIARELKCDLIGSPDVVVNGISLNSQSVTLGDVFAAIPGRNFHGAKFVSQALASGAVAILTDPEGLELIGQQQVPIFVSPSPRSLLGPASRLIFHAPDEGLQLVGITGTNGKTTTAFMVAAGARAAGKHVGLIGTLGIFIDEKLIPHARTTPEAPDLFRTLAHMKSMGVDFVVMEVSSIALEECRIDGLIFDVVGFTNLSHDHLDYHGTMEAYFDAKSRLFTSKYARSGVTNIDDRWGKQLIKAAQIPMESVSLDARADWTAARVESGQYTVTNIHGTQTPMHLSMPGKVNVANALLAVSLLARLGYDSPEIATAVGKASVPGRGELIATLNGADVYVDYAHSPDAIAEFLTGLHDRYRGRIVVVLGAGGDRDSSKRAEMGLVAAQNSSIVIVTDDNPRSEDPTEIRDAITAGAMGASNAEIRNTAGRENAIRLALTFAEPDGAIAILGKGHESTMEIMGELVPFSDADVIRALVHNV
jgi:UDP-N-acetylmuramoyl-L-alanyl-D-glutamate--2,6-diaminopimelate ligase